MTRWSFFSGQHVYVAAGMILAVAQIILGGFLFNREGSFVVQTTGWINYRMDSGNNSGAMQERKVKTNG